MSNVTGVKAGDRDAIVVISNESTSTSISLLKNPTPELSAVSDSPRIICNELLVKPQTVSTMDHFDELSSLEREIAKMHHVDDTTENTDTSAVATSASLCFNSNNNDSNNLDVYKAFNDDYSSMELNSLVKHEANRNPIASGETSLEHEDLIAVLKGLDDGHNSSGDGELIEGVTIEGEGEYQIMEVIDDDSTAPDEATASVASIATINSPTKSFGASLLTNEEERALAMEQMECLKTKTRRRKQDIKPIKQTDSVMDLVSALEAEWTDTDEEAKESISANNSAHISAVKTEPTPTAKKQDLKSPLVTSVVVIPTPNKNSNLPTTSGETSTSSSSATTSTMESNEVVVTKSSPIDGIIETKTEEDSQFMTTNTGFRRTRVIKRKIIWDPDAPETTFSYAKLVASNKNKIKQESTPITSSTITKGSTTIRPIKKEPATNAHKKMLRPVTPKDKKLNADTNSSFEKKSAIIKKTTSDELEIKTMPDSRETMSSPVSVVSPPIKRRSQTPVANGPGCAKKKKVTELDRLMGDEGAVNMLNSLEKLESSLGGNETKPTRPMMRSRASTICEKATPRKDSTSPVKTPPPTTNLQINNKGKRTVKSRASSSWDYVYQQKQQNLDDSMIIRRRSNSSYSSTASLNRLSIDGPSTTLNIPTCSSSKVNETTTSSTPLSLSSKVMTTTPEESNTLNNSKSAGAGTKANSTSPSGGKSFEFAKPENKKAQRRTKSPGGTLTNDLQKPEGATNKRVARNLANANDDKSDIGAFNRSPTHTNCNTKEKTHTSDVVVKKSSKVTQIIFSTNKAKISYTFTTQMLNKLVDILDKLASDPDTHVTVITTNDAHFCQGIDLAELVASGSTEKRKNAVKHLLSAVKKYLKTLATFPKPLIVGVNGHVMNLGVMQLALFDIVVAGDKCTYETPYVKLGQVPEGYSLWNSLNKIRGSFKTKLFWLSEKIQSTEAVLAGLVNKLTTGNKVNEEAVIIAKKIASLSPEAYRVMKKTTSHCYLDVIDSSFDEEFNMIAEQWSSPEFLENIKKYLDQGHF